MECIENLRLNLRRVRLAPGLTQQGLADLADIEYKYLQNIEAGRWPNLTLSTVQKIADALKLKPWELLRDPQPNAETPSRVRGKRAKPKKRP